MKPAILFSRKLIHNFLYKFIEICLFNKQDRIEQYGPEKPDRIGILLQGRRGRIDFYGKYGPGGPY